MADSSAGASAPETVVLDQRYQAQKEAASSIYSDIYDWQTRLLFLLPGNFGEPLIAKLHTVELVHGSGVALSLGKRRRVEYTALSYCWGPPQFEKDMLCNDKLYPITQNLFDALQHIRLGRETLPLWVDAICINQHHTEERSMQIANILTIFHKAKEVIAWLGNEGIDTSYALQKLREKRSFVIESEIHSSSKATSQAQGADRKSELVVTSSHPSNSIYKSESEEHQTDRRVEIQAVGRGVRELLQRPWFRRVWVRTFAHDLTQGDVTNEYDNDIRGARLTYADGQQVRQEVFAARIVELQCGEQKVLLEDLHHLPELRNFARRTPFIVQELETGEIPNPYLIDDDAFREFGFKIEHADGTHRTDIVNILNRVANGEASDPRDFVYGVLGMTRTVLMGSGFEQSVDALVVNYRKNVSEVFEDVSRYVMERDQCLNVLILRAHFGGTIHGCKLASWVPDWRFPTSSYPWLEYAKIMSGAADRFISEKLESARVDSSTIGKDDNGVLTLQGFILGYVASQDSALGGDSVWQLADNRDARCLLVKLAWEISEQGGGMQHSPRRESLESIRRRVDKELLEADPTEGDSMREAPIRVQIRYIEFGASPTYSHARLSVEVPWAAVYLKKNHPMPLPRLSWPRDKKIDGALDESLRPPNPLDTKFVDISTHTDVLRGTQYGQALCQRIIQALYSGSKKDTDKLGGSETVSSAGFNRSGRGTDHPEAEAVLRLTGKHSEEWKPKSWLVSNNAQIGDVILFVHGGLLPLVVRRVSGNSQYELVGPAALPEWTFGNADRHVDECNCSNADSDLDVYLDVDGADADGATIDRRFRPQHYYLLWRRLLEIHKEDNRLETFHLV